MTRPIEFRGKLKASEEWAFGNLNKKVNGTYIITPDETPLGKYGAVDPSTVCEYTGRDDIDGVKIFEHDMVQIGYVRSDKSVLWYGVMEVTFRDGAFMLGTDPLCKFTDARLKVIGNVFDGRARG